MCGIIGRVAPAEQMAALELEVIHHRGPDDCGQVRAGNALLGHARLSIIDIAGGAQPMDSSDGRMTIVFNGEIYNYRELRAELQVRGYRFASASDTEVILAAYQIWGVPGFARLRGMYAFALADRQDGSTLLVRDPFGIKPLFVHQDDRATLFGSEVGAIISMLGRVPEIDRSSVLETLIHRYPMGNNSLYGSIKRLEPGVALIIDREGRSRTEQFASLADAVERERLAGARGDTPNVRVRIADSVTHHSIADVPVGCFLSGGLDSSIVALKLARASSTPVRAYSVSFQSTRSERSELPYARAVAEAIGADLIEVSVSGDDFAELAPQLSGTANGPFPDPADVAMLKMSLAASRDVKVVLSGEGADEAFAGYPKYAFNRLAGLIPSQARSLVPATGLGRAGIALRALGESDRSLRFMRWFQNPDAPAGLLGSLVEEGADPGRAVAWLRSRVEAYPSEWSELQRMQVLDLESWLPNNLLHRGDYTTMQASLEQRVPFLDIETTPWAVALPDRAKIEAWRGKKVLRRGFAERLPPEVARRSKSGFRLPLGEWLQSPGRLRSLAHDRLLAPNAQLRTWVSSDQLGQLLEPRALATVGGAKLAWTALSLELWLGSLNQVSALESPLRKAVPVPG